MIEFNNGARMVESLDELPNLQGAQIGYLDFETSSMDPDVRSVNPFKDCQPLGIAITVDDCPNSWYLPVAHHDGKKLLSTNLPHGPVYEWLEDVIKSWKTWANANVKYDAHVLHNYCCDLPDDLALTCLTTRAKLLDSDRGFGKGTYELESLSEDWLGESIRQYDAALQPYLPKKGKFRNKDYGLVPPDIMGEYAGQDVLTARRLHKYLNANLPAQCNQVRDTEEALTRVLFETEQSGLHIDMDQIAVAEVVYSRRLLEICSRITEIIGYEMTPWSADDCFDLLCNSLGLPVLEWTENGTASFNKYILEQYKEFAGVNVELIDLILNARKIRTILGLFIKSFKEHQTDGFLHSEYNQCVRTGRMACKRPNAQQITADVKKLILPDNSDMSFINFDYSQVEYRMIAHFIQDERTLEAYAQNPRIDYHSWVAEVVGCERTPAKTINFMLGFGGGEKKCVATLSKIKSVVDACEDADAIQRMAKGLYDKYHETLPSLKRTSRLAAKLIKQTGFVFNPWGRHRRLPVRQAHKAFNSLCQSSAADLTKNRLVALYNEFKGTDLSIKCTVHDSVLVQCPTELVPEWAPRIEHIMCTPDVEFSVPFCVDYGSSNKSWGDCGD